jgi:uncharacterized protein
MPSALNWFQIPAADGARARAFYETICGVKLEELMPGSPMQMWGFPADPAKGEIGGAIVCGEGAVPSATGTMVFLNGDPDLQTLLDRVEGAGGKILAPKTLIDEATGYFAVITDTEGNTVGLHSLG